MAPPPATESRHRHRHRHTDGVTSFIQSTASNLSSLFTPKASSSAFTPAASKPSNVCVPLPLLVAESPPSSSANLLSSYFYESNQNESFPSRVSSLSSAVGNLSSDPGSGFPSAVRISGLDSSGKAGGPAFVGQVFSMCDLSGTGLMAVSTHFDIPFISKRTPEWLKKMFQSVIKSERNGPVFRFFMDLGDAVSYVKRLNIPSGVVGACRLDLAYEHFKVKPHLFQFVPNDRQVREANKLLKARPQRDGKKKVDGVPVFSAQNLDIAIATTDGVKWYTPYFFDKNMLDNILEESVDQHFQSLIRTRHLQRRRDVVDDNLAAEVLEENAESIWEPPEVQEVLDEMGNPGIPLSVISKAAEIQLLYAVDQMLLGNRWLRKATGIQPRFPYIVDSFEKRSAASCQRASKSLALVANELEDSKELQDFFSSEIESQSETQDEQGQRPDFPLSIGNWFSDALSKPFQKPLKSSDSRNGRDSRECIKEEMRGSPFLPKITMVGISTGDTGNMSKGTLKKTMDDLTKELERTGPDNRADGSCDTKHEERDPLFVANVGDYYSAMSRAGSSPWVRPRIS